MLDLLLTSSDGGTAWRHLLAEGEARAGWECVGPLGLAKRLGRLYGLRGEPAPHPERMSAFAARLARLDDGARSFSRSRRADPWGVAAFLLGLRDRLRGSEWDGGDLDGSPRLADLAAVERLTAPGLPAIPPGLEDVLAGLAAEIERAPTLPEPLAIRAAAPEASFDPVLRRVLAALAARGARVERAPDGGAAAPEATDLGRLQRALLATGGGKPGPALAGDGTVLVLEADAPLEAAELAAAWARSRPGWAAATLVAGRDPGALEAALSRQGLPAIGVADRSRWRPALQLLPLRLALAFAPKDPFRAAELLTLPVSPIPKAARRRLLEALVEQPGVGGPAWRAAVEEVVAHAAERARREHPSRADAAAAQAGADLRERVEAWFGGPSHDPRAGIPAPEAIAVCETVARFAESRARAQAEEPDALLEGAARVARSLARMLAAEPPDARLSPVALERLHDVAAGAGMAGDAPPGAAGRPAIALEPGAVHDGVREVVWWGFLGGDPAAAPEPWTPAERAALLARGVRVPDAGERRGAEARAWRRPVLAASERLVLVRWRLEGAALALAHPLADEIAARFERALAPCAVASEAALGGRAPFAVAASPRPPASEIVPRATFRVPPEAIATDRLSPSSLEKLLGCPVAWVLEYAAGLRRRGMARIPTGGRLLGTFAHALLEDLLLGPARLDLASATPAEAAGWAARAFDDRVGTEAAPLVARGAEVERHRAREVVSRAAGALFALLQAGGWRARAAEQALSGRFEGADLAGSADLVLERAGRPGVLDLKLSNAKLFQEKLQGGQALQVALYADLARAGGPLPPTGYFIVSRGELLTVDPGAFPGAREVSGPSMEDTLAAARDALRFWRAVLARGVVASRHEDLVEASALEAAAAAGRPSPATGPGAVDPPCGFCEYGALCGVTLREVVR